MANLYGPRIVTDGLTLHLDATNTKSYNGSGTTIYDISGNGYNHTKTNAAFVVIDGVKCFNCTANGDKIVDSGTTFTLGSSHTFIAWARVLSNASTNMWRTLWRTLPDDHPLIISYGTGGGSDGDIGYYDNGGLYFVGYGVNVATLGIENKWTMYTVVGDSNYSYLYINDEYKGSVNRNASGVDHDSVGQDKGYQPFGYLATATVYANKALSADEISRNYNALKGRFGL